MNNASKSDVVAFVDADNTLWDTDAVFADAQLQLLAEVESRVGRVAPGDRLHFIRTIDQILAEHHHDGLRYPPKYLVAAVAWALRGTPLDKSLLVVWQHSPKEAEFAADEASAIVRDFIANISRSPGLLPGVEVGLRRLKEGNVRIFVISEGDRRRVSRRLVSNRLEQYVDKIIEAPKHERLYRRILRLAGSPKRAWMVGDQLSRDIAPAISAGLSTIYIPSRFRPRWEAKETSVMPAFKVQRFDQAVNLIMTL